jgi:hypothetical protein
MRAVEWREERVTVIEQRVLLRELLVAEYEVRLPRLVNPR